MTKQTNTISGASPFYDKTDLPRVTTKKTPKNNFWGHVFGFQYNLESIFREFKRKEMKSSRRLAKNDIITRGVTVKMQQVAQKFH
jgi:hypothetical protein